MAAEAVGHGLEQLRLALLARLAQRLGGGRVHVEHVHAVAARTGHAVALGLLRKIRDGGVTLEGRAHPELVVDHHEHNGQLPERSHVHRLAEGALVGGAVTEHAHHGVVGALVVALQRHAGGERQVAAHDPVAAEEAALDVEQVHRPAATVRAAVHAAEQLGHHRVRMSAARNRLAVLAIGGEQVVAVAHRLRRVHHRGLLANAEVEEAADLRLRVHLARALLEAADQHHLREHRLTGVLVRQRVLALRAVSRAVAGAFLPRYSSFARHRGLTLANSLGFLFEPVVAPEHLLADRNRGDTGYAAGDRLVRGSSQLILHRSHLYSGEYRARVQLTR